MAVEIKSGAGATTLTVDATSNAARVLLYDALGNPIIKSNLAAIVPATQGGILNEAADYKTARLLRASSNGTLRTSDDSLMLYDSVEGAAVDTNKWIQTISTQTITQAAGVMTFNANSTLTINTGAMNVSHRSFANITRSSLIFRTRVRMTAHTTNNQIQFGFGVPTAANAVAVLNGAFWRKDGSGQIVPVVSFGGSEQLGVAISDATFRASVPATDYCWFEIFLEDTRATFRIYKTTGELVHEQVVEFGVLVANFTATHFQVFHQICNTGTVAVTAVQLLVSAVSVFACDSLSQVPFDVIQAGMNYGTLTVPTTYLQAANYANSAAPASATLSNTAAGYTTLGGQWQFVAVGGAETDFALFGFQNPSPYAMVVKNVLIHAFNMGAAVATTPHLLQWALGFNSSAVSLATGAPYTPMKKAIGVMSIAVGAAIGANFSNPVSWSGTEIVQPGRFFHVILKIPVGTATASQIIRGTCDVEGFFV